MITTRLDHEMVTITNFTHPEYGVLRIIGDYDTNPGAMEKTAPMYKCQQINSPKNFYMLPKTLVKELVVMKKS